MPVSGLTPASGTKDFETFENKLELLEKPADPIFQKLRAHQSITHEEKCLFSAYIIQMYRRVVAGRERIRELLATNAYEPSKELFQKIKIADTPEAREDLKQIFKKISDKEGYDIQAHNRITAAAPDSVMIGVLQEMTWVFYISPAPHVFVASDNPVFISEQCGLLREWSELSFPISSDVALVASWRRFLKEGFSLAGPQIVKEVNRRTIGGASQYVYSSQNPKWVMTVLDKRSYEYHPLYAKIRL